MGAALRQSEWGGLELVPAWSHKPSAAGSNPAPATIAPLAQLAEAPGLGPGCSGFESLEGHNVRQAFP